jgi:hypothetical protein
MWALYSRPLRSIFVRTLLRTFYLLTQIILFLYGGDRWAPP